MLFAAFVLPLATMKFAAASSGVLARPEGPCDIYAAANTPCAAAHSATRALYASYNGPLYQVMRQSDGKRLDIGVVGASATDAGGYADAAAQDAFCANTYCWITTLYDQSGHGNNLTQAPHGGFNGPASGGFNNVPLADMAPVTVMGHKAYGVFIEPGMGLRLDDAKGTAVDDQAEGQYWVLNGRHYNGGCCFDYGNAETDSRDDGDGTMETAYYGNATPWFHGPPPGPWIMTDQENNLVGCVNPDGSKLCDLPSIDWRFVTAVAKGEPHHWTSMGGNAQQGALRVMFDGPRVDRSYDPMRKQGAILLGNGGDNSNGSQGTFYEGAMTAGGTFPTDATDQLVQANVVAAGYDEPALTIAPASGAQTGVMTFARGGSRELRVSFKNTSGEPATGVRLDLLTPRGWKCVATDSSSADTPQLEPGATLSATFRVTSGSGAFNGDLVARATWVSREGKRSTTAVEKARSVSPVRINEFASNATNSFIELFNAGDTAVDLSGWSLTEHAAQQPILSSIKIPAGTTLASRGFYLLGLSNSGLAVPARKGDSTLYVRSVAGMNVGDTVQIGTGAGAETRHIASIGTPAEAGTTIWQPLPDGPVISAPVGSTNIPYSSPNRGFGAPAAAFSIAPGSKIAVGYGATYPAVSDTTEKYEIVTVTEVGKPGTQAYLAADAKPGDTNLKVSSVANISVGDTIRLDIDSRGHGIETVTVTKVGTQSRGNPGSGRISDPGTGLDIAEPLKFAHAANMPFSVRGTGIAFEPSSAHVHRSNEPIVPLGTGITLDRPLSGDHDVDSVVRDAAVTSAGYRGGPPPNQWFGGPEISPRSGSMVLRDRAGHVVDSLNYGGLVDPWAAKGYQAESPGSGCSVPSPSVGGFGFGPPNATTTAPIVSAGRIDDGVDTDSNCADFAVQTATTLATDSMAGAKNIKFRSVYGLEPGQTLLIDTGGEREKAVIATVGTAGGTTLRAAAPAGAREIQVAFVFGFQPGQAVTIDDESAVIASIVRPRGFGGGGGGRLTLAAPLMAEHPEGAVVAGTGVTLEGRLDRAHASGTPVANGEPTPGAPNHYVRRR